MSKVFIDSREQTPWSFSFYGFDHEIIKLETGDYFFEDYPDLIIERKKTTGEICTNLSKKWKQFEAELIRMSQYKYPYLICEFPIEYIDIFPVKSGIPSHKLNLVRMPGWVLKRKLLENCSKYNINTIFCHDAEEAQQKVIGIIEEICK